MEAECFFETLAVMLSVYQNRLRHISAFVCVYIHRTDRQTVMWYRLMIAKFVNNKKNLERDFSKILTKTLFGILDFNFLSARFVQSRRHNGQLVGWKEKILQRNSDFNVSPEMWRGDNSTTRIFMKFQILVFCENPLRKLKFRRTLVRITGTFLVDLFTVYSYISLNSSENEKYVGQRW